MNGWVLKAFADRVEGPTGAHAPEAFQRRPRPDGGIRK